MPITANYVFIASMDVAPEMEDLFNEVYDQEHIPSLLEVPGVLAVSRYKSEPLRLSMGGEIGFRVDWSYRDSMYGEPSSDPGRFTKIDSRSLVNFDITYTEPEGRWSLSAYGRNVFNKKYDNARLLPTDYVLIILNNDLSEFGLRYIYNFGG